jgi:steroid delta-isomerase-like uncharacterized protein
MVTRSMSLASNKVLIERYYDKLWNLWDLGIVEEIVAPDVRFHGSLGVAVEGAEGFRRYVQLVRDAFPDFHNTIEDLVAENDRVAARLRYTGTHSGPLFGVAPTGKQIEYAGLALFHIKNGRIVSGFVLGDLNGLMRQLGLDTITAQRRPHEGISE